MPIYGLFIVIYAKNSLILPFRGYKQLATSDNNGDINYQKCEINLSRLIDESFKLMTIGKVTDFKVIHLLRMVKLHLSQTGCSLFIPDHGVVL